MATIVDDRAVVVLNRVAVSIAPQSPPQSPPTPKPSATLKVPQLSPSRLPGACPFARLAPAAAACPVTGARQPQPHVLLQSLQISDIVSETSAPNNHPSSCKRNPRHSTIDPDITAVTPTTAANDSHATHTPPTHRAPVENNQSDQPLRHHQDGHDPHHQPPIRNHNNTDARPGNPCTATSTPIADPTPHVIHPISESASTASSRDPTSESLPAAVQPSPPDAETISSPLVLNSTDHALVVVPRRRCPWWARALRFAARQCAKQVLIRSLKPVMRNSLRVVLHVLRNIQGPKNSVSLTGGCPVVHAIVKPSGI